MWLWSRLAATAPIGPLAWKPPYTMGVALKKKEKKRKKKEQKKKKKKEQCGRFTFRRKKSAWGSAPDKSHAFPLSFRQHSTASVSSEDEIT